MTDFSYHKSILFKEKLLKLLTLCFLFVLKNLARKLQTLDIRYQTCYTKGSSLSLVLYTLLSHTKKTWKNCRANVLKCFLKLGINLFMLRIFTIKNMNNAYERCIGGIVYFLQIFDYILVPKFTLLFLNNRMYIVSENT